MNAQRVRLLLGIMVCIFISCTWFVFDSDARNVSHYSDTLSDSAPSDPANHTIQFTTIVDIPASSALIVTPPDDFSIVSAIGTSTFTERNVELLVNGTARTASSTGAATVDQVTINTGSPGSIVYALNPTTGISGGDVLTLKIGDHTTFSLNGGVSFSTSTGTTTIPNDTSGVINASAAGKYDINLTVTGSGSPVYTDFVVFLVEEVGLGPADTTEQIPPYRFNGLPAGDVGGTTLNVEMSLETDEFAICKFDTTASTSYAAMGDTFDSTGLIVHTHLFENLTNNTTYTYYIRCIDDEGNFNIDDYVITFTILDVPDGIPNTTGSTTGDGTGSGDDGTGTGGGGGGQTGSSDGGSNTSGGSSGSGGSGGGSGGTSGSDSEDNAGGGFESTDKPYRSGDGQVIINGTAFPRSDIVVLVDGQQAETGRADSSGSFSVTIDEIARGVYTFGIYATDSNNKKSSTFSTTFSVQGARTSVLSNINIMPTVVVNPDPADIGETVTVSGYAIPDATITIQNEKDKQSSSKKEFTTTSNSSGAWSTEISTAGFSQGTYKVKAKAKQEDGTETNYSDYTYYGVGQTAESPLTADLNRDGKVNLTDFSILLFHWGSSGGSSDPPADINRDGNVSLTDFSIMLFQWTG